MTGGPGADPALARALALVRDVPDHPTPGVLFKDITPLLRDAGAVATVVHALAQPHAAGTAAPVDLVAGMEARGFLLAAPVALALRVGFVPVRKAGKLPRATVRAEYVLEYASAAVELHEDAVQPGQRVLLVDDVLATGGTAAAAAGLVRRLGGEVVGLDVLLEIAALSGRGALAGLPVRSLLTA